MCAQGHKLSILNHEQNIVKTQWVCTNHSRSILGFHAKILVAMGLQKWILVRTYQKCPWCLVKPMSASSKMAKAEPISNGGSASGDNVFKKKNYYCAEKNCSQRREAWERERERALQTPSSVEKEAGECSKCWRKDSPAPHVTDRDETDVPMKTMEINKGSDIYLQPMEDALLEKTNAWKKDVTLWEDCAAAQAPGWTCGPMEGGVHTEEGFLAGLLTMQGTHCWSSTILKDCMLWKIPILEQFMKN